MKAYNTIYKSIFLIAVLLCSCTKKDKNPLSDYELFNRLQQGSGKWTVVKIEKWKNNTQYPTVEVEYPEQVFYHFYMKSIILPAGAGSFETGDFYVNGQLVFSNKVEAETERVSFPTGLGEGEVWTVEVNKRNKQVWLRMFNDDAVRIEMKPCNCSLPNPTGEIEG